MRSDTELFAIVNRTGWLNAVSLEPQADGIKCVLGELTDLETDRLFVLLKAEYGGRRQRLATVDRLESAIKKLRDKA